MKKLTPLLLAVLLVFVLLGTSSAISITFDVDAYSNSSSGGSGLFTGIYLTSGQEFSVATDESDHWSAGALPRWSNADGLIDSLYATGADDSGESAGTLIGISWTSTWTQNGLTAPYGSLVGQIDGVYSLLGADFLGNAWATGELSLYYWDSNNYDNEDFISVTVNDGVAPVPEPSTILLLGSGLVCLAWYGRKRKKA